MVISRVENIKNQLFHRIAHNSPTIPHSSTFAQKIPWTEEPGRLQSMGSLESDTTEQLHFHFSLACIGEGNGNPLQCSCLENPRDGVAESDTTEVTQQQQQQQPPLVYIGNISNDSPMICGPLVQGKDPQLFSSSSDSFDLSIYSLVLYCSQE